MILNILWIIIGIVLVLWGADRMTDGAVALAQRMNIPQIVIGLTIVAMGTSAPELFVSLMSAIRGTADLAVGNVVGSNIFNAFLIVGVAALVAPMVISRTTVKKDIPFAVFSSILLAVLCWDADISRLDAIILFAGLIVFMLYTLHVAKKGKAEVTEEQQKNYTPLKSVLLIVLGLACLVGGSNLFVEGATKIAAAMGVSEAVIGLTVVAGGTSLPELATSVVAAYKGRSAIAIGNVLGSNVFNILMVLGATAVIHPMRIMGITIVDLMMMLVSVGILWLFAYTKYSVSRREGAVLILGFAVYMGWLLYLL